MARRAMAAILPLSLLAVTAPFATSPLSMQHVLARAGTAARGCPPAESCSCHCNCPETTNGPAPPLPAPCPIYPSFPVSVPALPPPPPKKVVCDVGTVKTHAGKCEVISAKHIEVMKGVVAQMKRELDEARAVVGAAAGVRCGTMGVEAMLAQRGEGYEESSASSSSPTAAVQIRDSGFEALYLSSRRAVDQAAAAVHGFAGRAADASERSDFAVLARYAAGLTDAPGDRCNFEVMRARREAARRHDDYRRALDMLLAMLGLYKPPPTPAAGWGAGRGPEFVAGSSPEMAAAGQRGEVHCEFWTATDIFRKGGEAAAGSSAAPATSTAADTKDTCAVLCRHEVSCIGFALSPALEGTGDVCVWFSSATSSAPAATSSAASPTATAFLQVFAPPPGCQAKQLNYVSRKVRQAPASQLDHAIQMKVQQIRGLNSMLATLLAKADEEADAAGGALDTWSSGSDAAKLSGMGVTDPKKVDFLKKKDTYTATLSDIQQAQTTKDQTVGAVSDLLRADGVASPPFAKVVIVAKTSVDEDTKPKVVPLSWKNDFAQSQDSQWAQAHPECPEGPPCACDCHCRGVPGQNFIVAPPPPPAPCPPAPVAPPPGVISLPMR